MKKILILSVLLLATLTAAAQFRYRYTTYEQEKEQQKQAIRDQINLDYTVPDYSISKINAKVMGPRLAKILESICANYTQPNYLSLLSLIQTSQVEGLSYGRIKSLKLENVTKTGNELTIRFDTVLEPNRLNLKKSQLVFHFVDGVSEDTATNDFFCMLCRYIKE